MLETYGSYGTESIADDAASAVEGDDRGACQVHDTEEIDGVSVKG